MIDAEAGCPSKRREIRQGNSPCYILIESDRCQPSSRLAGCLIKGRGGAFDLIEVVVDQPVDWLAGKANRDRVSKETHLS